MVDRGRAADAGRVRATTVKIMQDGVVENYSAAMLEPYLDPVRSPDGHRGLTFVDPEALRTRCTALDARGLPGPLPRDR